MAYIDRKKDVSVTQDNQIIESCYTMTLNEKRLLLLGMSKINPLDFPDTTRPFGFTVTLDDWVKYYPDTCSYRDFKKSAKLLKSRSVTFHEKAMALETDVNWFEQVDYTKQASTIRMVFTRPMQVRLAGLLDQFTKIDLLSVSKLNSIYSIRLYEILSQYKSMGYRVISVDDLRFALDCKNKYKTTKQLKQSVLNPALHELKNNSDLKITFSQIKQGRTITHFKFIFSR